LANPVEVKNRKGHQADAWWLAHLLRHGMIRPSFIPDKQTRDLRELTGRRKKLIGQVAQERNRVQKQLEYGSEKLGNQLSDVFGLSGQLMLKALVDGERTPEQIAELAQGSLKKKKAAIAEAVRGQRLSDIQKELIRSSARHMVFLELEIEQLDKRIAELIQAGQQQEPYQLLQTIPGLKQEAAANVLAETGPDMKPFPDAARLSSWGGVCPGNHESAGKHKSRHTTRGNPWFRATLIESAWAASRKKGSALRGRTSGSNLGWATSELGRGGPRAGASHPLCAGYWSALSRARAGGVERVPATTADPRSHPAPSPPGLLAPGGKAHPFKGLVRLSLPPLPRSASRPTSRSQAEVLPSSSPRRGPVMTLEHGNCFQNNTDKHRWKRVVLSAFIGVNPRLKRY
jgi:transposase